jgi:hypothetical protein
MTAPDATGARISFSEIPPDLFQKAFDAWKRTHPHAARSREHARRGIYRFNPGEPRDLQAVADVLEARGEFFAAAAVHADRARLQHDTVSRETRAWRSEVERTAAGLLERADRPGDALRMYEIARPGLEADPNHAESARSCRDSITRLEAQRSVHAAKELATERERLVHEATEFFSDGQSVDGVRRPEFQSTEELSQRLGQHLRDGEFPKAEPIAEEIDFRLRGREPGLLFLRNRTILAELREQRRAVIPAEPLRESVYLTSVQLYGHSDPRTIEAARNYVANLRSKHNLGTPDIYARAYDLAQSAMRKAEHGRVAEVLRYLASGRRSARPVPKALFDAAKKSLEASAMAAGQDARRTADQLPPRLYSNPQRGLRGAVGRARHGGARRGVVGRNATAKDSRARRAGR